MTETFDDMNCDKCGKPGNELPWYHISYNNTRQDFCSRRCLVEFIAPEVSKAVVVGQWISPPEPTGHTPVEVKRYVPTPDEERRMSEEST